MNTRQKKCASCAADAARYRCAGCRAALYCGASCQRRHWLAGHHAQCTPVVAAVAAAATLMVSAVPNGQYIGAALAAGTTLRPFGGAAKDDLDLVARIGGGAVAAGGVWSARRGAERFVAKLFSINDIGERHAFAKEVYVHRLLARITPTLCRRAVRCAAESFVDKRSDGRFAVVAFRSPIGGDPFDLDAFVAKTLAPLAKRDRREYLELLGSVATDLVNDVAALHGAGIAHRDIKPANVLVDQSVVAGYNAVMIDLGSARPFDGNAADVFAAADGTPKAGALSGIDFTLTDAERRALRRSPPTLPRWATDIKGGIGSTPLYFDPRIAFTVGGRLRIETFDFATKDFLVQLDEFALGATLYEIEITSRGPIVRGSGSELEAQLRPDETQLSVIIAQQRAAAKEKLGAGATPEDVDKHIENEGVWRWKPPADPTLVLNGVIQELIAREPATRFTKPLRADAGTRVPSIVNDIGTAIKKAQTLQQELPTRPPPPRPAPPSATTPPPVAAVPQLPTRPAPPRPPGAGGPPPAVPPRQPAGAGGSGGGQAARAPPPPPPRRA